jgi:hypothetical protein
MLSLPGKYFVMVAKSWGRAVSGPVLAGVGLILSAVQIKITDNQLAANVLRYCLWSTLAIAGLMIFVAQYEVWRDERSVKEALERRLLPKAIIRNLTPRVWPAGQGGVSVTGKEYYFDIFNSSEAEALENVRVEVASILPDAVGYPNAPLHIRNDSYNTREFSINAGSVRQIDLITGPVNAPNSQNAMIVAHTVNDHRTAIPYDRYRITVRVSARNAPPEVAIFETWIENNELQCTLI